MSEVSKVEQYVASKNWEYQVNGDQIVVRVCPFCESGDFKFYINKDNFLWQCKRGSCAQAGNEWKLKTALGDRIEGVTSTKPEAEAVRKQERIPDIEQAHQWLLESDEWVNWLNDERGWSLETVKKQKIGLMSRWIKEEQKEVPCFVYPYFAGNICNFAKFRTIPGLDKNFSATGGRENPLYNQNAISKGMEYLLLTEGEADAISVLEMGDPNVVGVPGCDGKKVTWDKLLELPKKLYLLFDSDEAGQRGARGFAERFGIERFHNIVLPEFDLSVSVGERTKGKDVTEWLTEGHNLQDLHSLMKTAHPFDIEGVTGLDASLDELVRDMEERGTNEPRYKSPWPSLNRCIGGAEDKHLVIIQAQMKTGKTSLALNWADDLVANQGVSVYFECLEMDYKQLSRKWASFITKTDDTPGRSMITPEVIRTAQKIARERPRELIFGAANYTKLDEVFNRWRAIIRRYGVKVMVFDNLQLLVDLLHSEKLGGRVSFMSKVTKKCKAFAMEMGILFILIAQTKRIDDDKVADSSSLEGSSAPGNDCDLMIVMNRTKQDDIKKKSDLAGMGNIQTEVNLRPELFIKTDLSRYAPGGWTTLYMEGGMSWVRERKEDEELAAAAHSENTINGFHFEPVVEANLADI
jgi:KaiC/GvpD/RAD55 family RecA-like ATPase/5S rRNA maturation endonuclease (ribonuclease M5)